ncbi:hypothetical protein [Pedobacter sp. ASV28]|uniref:hypothetical protein n=1 Tax=Pedobacter sp. ASV28 TaxID=2795123 RepID=UPI0018EAF963|nr:hypothetical protein [Pedobacter sp. ASV28]
MKPSKIGHNLSLIFVLSVCCSLVSFAQQETVQNKQPTEVASLNKIRLNLIGLGYEREQKIGKTTTFYVGAGLEGSFIYNYELQIQQTYSSNGSLNYTYTSKSNSEFKIFPALNTGIRYYYNFQRRIKKGKNTFNNAAGYIAFDMLGLFPTKEEGIDYQINLGPMWGFQTNAGKKVNFELCLGPGFAITNKETAFYGVGGKIGFSFLL